MDLVTIANAVAPPPAEYISTDDLREQLPNGFTVKDAFEKDKDGEKVMCFHIEEMPGKYAYATSGDLKKIFEAWVEKLGGIEKLNAKLAQEKVKLTTEMRKWKGGKYLRAWVVSADNPSKDETEMPF